jgi:hypothetical protein
MGCGVSSETLPSHTSGMERVSRLVTTEEGSHCAELSGSARLRATVDAAIVDDLELHSVGVVASSPPGADGKEVSVASASSLLAPFFPRSSVEPELTEAENRAASASRSLGSESETFLVKWTDFSIQRSGQEGDGGLFCNNRAGCDRRCPTDGDALREMRTDYATHKLPTPPTQHLRGNPETSSFDSGSNSRRNAMLLLEGVNENKPSHTRRSPVRPEQLVSAKIPVAISHTARLDDASEEMTHLSLNPEAGGYPFGPNRPALALALPRANGPPGDSFTKTHIDLTWLEEVERERKHDHLQRRPRGLRFGLDVCEDKVAEGSTNTEAAGSDSGFGGCIEALATNSNSLSLELCKLPSPSGFECRERTPKQLWLAIGQLHLNQTN